MSWLRCRHSGQLLDRLVGCWVGWRDGIIDGFSSAELMFVAMIVGKKLDCTLVDVEGWYHG